MFRLPRPIDDAVRNAVRRPGADATYGDGDDGTWITIDWPALTRRERIFGRDVNFVDTGGDGPPLLLVHGLAGCWQNWLLNIPAFMETHRVIAPDLPGFGASEMPAEEEISIQGYARVVDALCDRLGIESAIVVGNSMGGFVGAELALSSPTRVPRLVLVSAAGLSTENLRRELLTLARVTQVSEARAAARTDAIVRRPRLRRLMLQSVFRYPEKLSRPLLWEQVRGSGRPGFVPALRALMTYSYRERLAEIECPVLIVWGENDMLVTVRDAERYERLIGRNARKVVFEDTGHVAMLERPSRFNTLLSEFLAGRPAPEAPVEGVVSA